MSRQLRVFTVFFYGGLSAGWVAVFLWIMGWSRACDAYGDYCSAISFSAIQLPYIVLSLAVYFILLAIFLGFVESEIEVHKW